jgi:L-amino acid N-acyltransferase YncA
MVGEPVIAVRSVDMGRIIRPVEPSDAQAIRDIYVPFVSESATSFEVEPPDGPAMERRILDQRERYPWLVYEVDWALLGYAYASPRRAARKAYQWCVEVSIYIHGAARRRGVGQALYTSLFELLRRQGYVNAYAGITLPNPSSLGLHQSLGFVPVGVYPRIWYKFGKRHDVSWLQLRLQKTDAPIAEPLPVLGVFQDPRLHSLLQEQAIRAG